MHGVRGSNPCKAGNLYQAVKLHILTVGEFLKVHFLHQR